MSKNKLTKKQQIKFLSDKRDDLLVEIDFLQMDLMDIEEEINKIKNGNSKKEKRG